MALDIEESRLSRVRENLVRLGQIAQVICGDASKPEEWLEEGVLFDRILLDALVPQPESFAATLILNGCVKRVILQN